MSSSREEDPAVTVIVEDEVGGAASGGAEDAAESSSNNINNNVFDIPSSITPSSMDPPNLAGAKENNGNEPDGDFLLKIAEMRARGAPVPNQAYHPTDDGGDEKDDASNTASNNRTQQKLEKVEDNEVNDLKTAMGVAPEKVSRDNNQPPVMMVADPAIRQKSQLKVYTNASIKEVQVYVLLGQSNMLGMGHVGQYPDDIAKDGTLQCAVHQKGLYQYLLSNHNNNTGNGDWKTSSTVRNVRVMDRKQQGQAYKVFTNEFLTIHNGSRIGPEVGMGHVLEQSSHNHHHDEPVMLLKSCIGNRSLGWDLLPPGSSRYVYGDQMYAGYKDSPACWPKDEAKPDPMDWYAGKQYNSDVSHCQDVLANHLETYYPGATTYKVAGFFWWQGDKDRYTEAYGVQYEANLVRLIHQLRADFEAPDAKFVLATLGQTVMDNTKTDTEQTILKAMMAVDGNSGKYPEHLGNVATVYSHPLSKGGASNGHYNGNAETYMNVGEAMGQAMAELVLHQEESQIKFTTETPTLTGRAAVLNIGTAISSPANPPQKTSAVPAPPPPLTRGQRGVQSMNRVPGAEAVYPDTSRGNSRVTEPSSGSSLMNETSQLRPSGGGSGGNDGALHDEETLFVATLVNENSNPNHENVLVEAKPAFDGFKAIVRNKRFKYVVALFVLLALSVAIPVGLLLKKEDTETRFTTVNGTLVCGARDQRQTDYRGTTATTATGLTCQAWSSQSPWTHTYKPELYPSHDLGGHNFCRNPTQFGKDQRAWCYTTDPDIRWAYCSVPFCNETKVVTNDKCGTIELTMSDYRGNMSVTATGKTCQEWDAQSPHQHGYTSAFAFEAEGNFCRTFDEHAPWCFTTDPGSRWEFCDIPPCGSIAKARNNSESCVGCTTEQCGTDSVYQADYRGTINVTVDGVACEPWESRYEASGYFGSFDAEEHGLEMNYCRNPSKSLQPWCITATGSSVCDVPSCEETVPRRKCGTRAKSQSDYRGAISTTVNGRECVEWDRMVDDRQSRNSHPWDGLISNYCRNPDSARPSAWCYVQHGPSPFEFCDVPDCLECGSKALNRTDYLGTESITRTGKKCVYWEAKRQLLFQLNGPGPTNISSEHWILEENYCRNPTPWLSDNVWCYTSADENSTEWEYCDILDCDEEEGVAPNQTCGSSSLRQTDYRGFRNSTASGKICQSWSSQTPHAHKYTPTDRPQDGLDGNFCRNPTNESNAFAWCFTNDEDVRWDYCSVPLCENTSTRNDCGTIEVQQKDYRGSINRTSTGVTCQDWSSQTPHVHNFVPVEIGNETSHITAGLEGNFCRNPDGSDKAWCYTVDPDVLWGYCDVPAC